MGDLNKISRGPQFTARSAFSPWRYAHSRFIWLPRTITGTNPHHNNAQHCDGHKVFRQDWEDAGFFLHIDWSTRSACGDACNCYDYGM